MTERGMAPGTEMGGATFTVGTMAGGAFTGLAAMTVGWVVGFLIGMIFGQTMGEDRGLYTGMWHTGQGHH